MEARSWKCEVSPISYLLSPIFRVAKALLIALAMFALATPAFADITATYGFTTNTTLTDGSGQYTTSHVIGGFNSYTNVTTSLTMSSPNGGNPMWLGDIYSSLTLGLPSETERVAVLLNRPGRTDTNAFGSSLSSLNVTLDDSAVQPSGNIFATTSSTGTYNSDGRLGVNPYKPGVAYNGADRTNTLTTLNGSPVTSNTFTLLMADTEVSGIARLDSWGMGVTGAAATSGTMDASGGTFSITDDGGTNNLGAALVITQTGGGPLNVTATGALTFSGVVSGSGGLTKLGSGSLTLSAANTYSGGTNLSAGTLNINNAGSGGTSSAIGTGTLAISGGTTIDNTSGSAITLSTNNKQNWLGDFTFTGTNDLNLGTGSVGLNDVTRQVTVNAGTLTVGGVISDSAPSSPSTQKVGRRPLPPQPAPLPPTAVAGLTKAGAGTLFITGANTYGGATTVNGGTLKVGVGSLVSVGGAITVNSGGTLLLDGNGRHIGANTGVNMNGGTFNTGGFSEPNGGPSGLATSAIGALTLTATSTIDFGAGSSSILEFSGLGTHTASTVLQITNWDGVPLIGGSGDRLLFIGLATSFTTAYSQTEVSFNGTLGYTAVQFDPLSNPYYEIVATPVPEPSTWLAAALALGVLVFTQRRRFSRKITKETKIKFSPLALNTQHSTLNTQLPINMRPLTILALSLLALSPAARAQTVTSDPVGFTTASSLSNSDTLVSIPFTRPPEFTGAIQSVAGSVITVAGTPGWTTNQFVYAGGAQPKTYYVIIGAGGASNPKEGHTYFVSGNGANTLTVDTSTDNLTGIVVNTQVIVIPYWTPATIFPATDANVSFTATTSTASYKTQVLVPNNAAAGINPPYAATYFFSNNVDGTSGNVGWRLVGDNTTDHGNDALVANSYFVVRNLNGAPTLPLKGIGGVLTKKLATGLRTSATQAQDNAVSMVRPVDVTLNQSGLSPVDGSFVATPAFLPIRNAKLVLKDQLLLFDNSVAAFDKLPSALYYYSEGPGKKAGWKLFGDGSNDHGNDLIPAGSAMVIRKATTAAGQTVFWTNAPTY